MVEREKESDRPMIVRPGKVRATPYMRSSKVYDLIKDQYGLNNWSQDRIGFVVATNEKFREEWAKTDVEAKGEAFWKRKNLRERTIRAYSGGKQWDRTAAARGTTFHAVTNKYDTDLDYFADMDWADDLAVYTQLLEHGGFTVVESERFVVNDEFGIGGTFDKLLFTKQLTPDGEVAGFVIGDIKTGKVEDKDLEIGVQMAAYANSVYYEKGERTPFNVNKNWAALIHIPLGSNSAEVKWIDIKRCWSGIRAAFLLKELRDVKDLAVSAFKIQGPTLEEKIGAAPDVATLKMLYMENSDVWTDEHTRLGKVRQGELDGTV